MTAPGAPSGLELYEQSLVVDCLNGSALTPGVIARMRQARVTAVNLTAVRIGASLPEALSDLASVIATVKGSPDELMLVSRAEDIRLAKSRRRVGIILGLQDAEPIGREFAFLRILAELGVRIIQLTHNQRSIIGTGCCEPDDGLSRFGRRVVEEMNRLGLIIDVSHCGPRTTLDAIAHSAAPVLCSHANPSAVSPSPRNKSDDAILSLAEKGGVIGIAFWSPIAHRGDGRRPTIEDVLDCFDHALRLVGPDHVAIGSDWCEDLIPEPAEWARVYGPAGAYPEVTGGLGDWYGFETVNAEGLETAATLPAIANGLLARGHAAPTVEKVLGLNFARLFARVEGGGSGADLARQPALGGAPHM